MSQEQKPQRKAGRPKQKKAVKKEAEVVAPEEVVVTVDTETEVEPEVVEEPTIDAPTEIELLKAKLAAAEAEIEAAKPKPQKVVPFPTWDEPHVCCEVKSTYETIEAERQKMYYKMSNAEGQVVITCPFTGYSRVFRNLTEWPTGNAKVPHPTIASFFVKFTVE